MQTTALEKMHMLFVLLIKQNSFKNRNLHLQEVHFKGVIYLKLNTFFFHINYIRFWNAQWWFNISPIKKTKWNSIKKFTECFHRNPRRINLYKINKKRTRTSTTQNKNKISKVSFVPLADPFVMNLLGLFKKAFLS